jgi:DNA-binding IclR family transcriptional regulator
VLWVALCDAPEDGADVSELMRATGLARSTVYKYLAQLAEQGRAVQVGWGRWHAATPGEGDDDE